MGVLSRKPSSRQSEELAAEDTLNSSPPATPHKRFMSRPEQKVPGMSHRPRPNDGHLSLRLREKEQQRHWCEVWVSDPFHSFIALPLPVLVVIFALSHLLTWVVFAPVYLIESDICGLGTGTFLRALYFSLITQTTIGYGTADMHFKGCPWAFMAIASQTIVGLVLNGVLVGALYTKITRAKRRSIRILFSDKAVIRNVHGNYFFVFQVFDKSSSSDQVVEAHVRCYAIRHVLSFAKSSSRQRRPVYFQQCAMRLSSPNDELGAVLMMALPTQVIHRLDRWSPLVPAGFHKPSAYLASSFVGIGNETNEEEATSEECCLTLEEQHHGSSGRSSNGKPSSDACLTRKLSFRSFSSLPNFFSPRAAKSLKSHCCVPAAPKHTNLRRKKPEHRTMMAQSVWPGIVLREDDAEAGSRVFVSCDVCGEGFETVAQLERHLLSAARADRLASHAHDDCPPSSKHRHANGGHQRYLESSPAFRNKKHLLDRKQLLRRACTDARRHPLNDDVSYSNNGAPPADIPPPPPPPPPLNDDDDDADCGMPLNGRVDGRDRCPRREEEEEEDTTEADEKRLREYLEASDVEVLVVVEGIEPYTSSTLMARHSYNYKAGDILLNYAFPPCVDLAEDGAAVIDIDAFNTTEQDDGLEGDAFLWSTPSVV